MRDGCPLSLLVRNLRYTTSPDRVRRYFEQFGDVRDVYLPLDFYTKLPRGFGFVEFTRDEDAEAALQALSRYATLDGAEISVTVAQQGRKSPDSMRRRERVNHHGDRRSHGHYDDYDSRHRKGRTDSRGRYHQRYYRSRSRSCDGYRHSHTRRYRPEDRLSYRDHHRDHSYSCDRFSNNLRHRERPRHEIRRQDSRSSSEAHRRYRSRRSLSQDKNAPQETNRYISDNETSQLLLPSASPDVYGNKEEINRDSASQEPGYKTSSHYDDRKKSHSRGRSCEKINPCVHHDEGVTSSVNEFPETYGDSTQRKDTPSI